MARPSPAHPVFAQLFRHAAAAVLVLATMRTPATAQTAPLPEHVTVSFDRYASIETGADVTSAAASLLSRLQPAVLGWATDRRAIGVPLRVAWTIFVDHPVALFLVVFDHESYGHGGRAREFGSTAGATFGSPWTTDALFKGRTRFGAGASFDGSALTTEGRLHVYAGGVESNDTSAALLERDMVSGRRMRPMELLYFLRSRIYTTQYTIGHTPNPATDPAGFFSESHGGDLASYLGDLSVKYAGTTGFTPTDASPLVRDNYARIRRQAIAGACDPAFWLSLWTLGRDIATGKADTLPAPTIAGRRVLPIISSEWLTDGGVFSVETVVGGAETHGDGPRWSSVVVRAGNGPGGTIWNAGAATDRIGAWGPINVGGEFEVWRQPSSGTGGGVKIAITVTRGALTGLIARVGAKSAGDWPGRPAGRGPFVAIGYRLRSSR